MAEQPPKQNYGVLHLIGRDRVGILQTAAAFVAERGGTVEEGISHTLSTEAVVLLYISAARQGLMQIEKDTPHLGESLQLFTLFTRLGHAKANQDEEALPLTLRVSSPDFAGLLAAMTKFFVKHGLSIIAHHTHKAELSRAQGFSTYRHRFTVLLPSEFNRKKFIAELDELSREANFIRDDISHSDFY
jgi:glycine cleavage system regulatory protein